MAHPLTQRFEQLVARAADVRKRSSVALAAQTSSRARPLGLLAGNLLVLLVLLALVSAAIEGWYRFALDGSDGLGVTRVAMRWYERHWRTNGFGVRDDVEYGDGGGLRLATPTGVRRLTFFGDSVTAGQGVPVVSDRFANRIRSELGSAWEVHVFAWNGIDTGGQIRILRDLLAKGYRLGVVVLVYFPNDILDLVPDWGAALQRASADWTREPSWIRSSFALDFWWWRRRVALDATFGRYAELVRDAHAGEVWRAQEQRLIEMQALCDSRHSKLLVVTLPIFGASKPADALGDTYRLLDRFWKERGVPHLDLTRSFDGEAERWVSSRYDEHPNESAHALIAARLIWFLRENAAMSLEASC